MTVLSAKLVDVHLISTTRTCMYMLSIYILQYIMNRSITINMNTVLGPVVPSIVRLKSSLRGQHLKCFFLTL